MSGSPECSTVEFHCDFRSRDSGIGTHVNSPAERNLWCFWLISAWFSLLFNGSSFAQSATPAESQPVIGWHGKYLVGSWTEVVVNFEAAEAAEYEIRVTAPDPDGHRVTFSSLTQLPQGRHPLRGFFKVGQLNPEIEIAVLAAASGTSVWSWKSTETKDDLTNDSQRNVQPLDPAERLIVTVGNPPGFDLSVAGSSEVFRTIALAVEELPVHARAYDSVSLLVIAARSVVSAEQADAIRDWVSRGGRVVFSLPTELKSAREVLQPFASWIPVILATEPVTVSEFGKLEFYAGRNVRIPFAGRMPIPGIKITQGEVLAGSRDEALLVRSPYGLGSVTVLALDFTQPPLSKWTELSALGRRLAETSFESATTTTSAPSRNLQLSTTGVTDLATQLHAVQEDFPGVNRASPWLAMGLMIVLLLAIGPLDHVIVHRVLKWPRGTWITLPMWLMLFTALSISLATSWNGTSTRVNQLNVVSFDVNSSTCHQRLWTNVYSPATERRSISVKSAIVSTRAEPAGSRQSGWSGIPEAAFGGMLRPASVRVGNADYALAEDASIDGLPLMQWSSKPLLTEVHSSVEGLVECDLQSNGIGQLSGTLTHRFPGSIEDWLLAYGNRVYRHKKNRDDSESLPLPAGHLLRVDQPNVFPRELRAFLTGKVATGTQKQGSQGSDVGSQFTSYDPMSLDPANIVRMLTFHNEVGGTKYTGLTNRLLETEDLSRLLKLGRAVLFGRLNSPVADVQLDGKQISPDREITFIRIVLPVKKIGSDIKRHLEHLDK